MKIPTRVIAKFGLIQMILSIVAIPVKAKTELKDIYYPFGIYYISPACMQESIYKGEREEDFWIVKISKFADDATMATVSIESLLDSMIYQEDVNYHSETGTWESNNIKLSYDKNINKFVLGISSLQIECICLEDIGEQGYDSSVPVGTYETGDASIMVDLIDLFHSGYVKVMDYNYDTEERESSFGNYILDDTEKNGNIYEASGNTITFFDKGQTLDYQKNLDDEYILDRIDYDNSFGSINGKYRIDDSWQSYITLQYLPDTNSFHYKMVLNKKIFVEESNALPVAGLYDEIVSSRFIFTLDQDKRSAQIYIPELDDESHSCMRKGKKRG